MRAGIPGAVAACLSLPLALPALPGYAQSARDVISGSHLGAGYAGMLNLAASPDISGANYRITGDSTPLTIDVLRVPFEGRLATLTHDTGLFWRVSGGYLSAATDLPISDVGHISTRWSAYSLTGGVLARIRVREGWTFAPGLDVSVTRLLNRADYSGFATALQPGLDGLLFNWHTNAYMVTPNAAVDWSRSEAGRRMGVVAHTAWSWMSTFHESDPIVAFNESVGSYSLRAHYAAPTGRSVFELPLDWVVIGSYAGFYGGNRNALGFSTVAELGLGFEIPALSAIGRKERLRCTVSYLTGPHVTGWTIGLGVRL